MQERRWGRGEGGHTRFSISDFAVEKKKKKTAHAKTELMELFHKSFANYRQRSFQGRASELIGRTTRLACPGKHIRLYHYYSIISIIHSLAS